MATTSPSPKTGPGLTISLVLLILGVVVAATGFALAMRHLSEASTSDLISVPATIERTYDPGTYDIFVETIRLTDLFNDDALDALESDPREVVDIDLVDAAGRARTVTPPDLSLATGRGLVIFEHVGSFEVAVDEPLVMTIDADSPTRLIVAESPETAWREAVPWGIAGAGGSVLAIAGFVMLILGIVRRQRVANNELALQNMGGYTPTPPHAGLHTPPPPPAPGPPPGTPPPPPPATPNQQPPQF